MPLNFIAPEALGLYEANFIYINLTMTYRGCKQSPVTLPSLIFLLYEKYCIIFHVIATVP